MIFQDVIFSDHGHLEFGKDLQSFWIRDLNQMEHKMHISQCLYLKRHCNYKKTMFKDLPHKLLGSLNLEIQT